MYPFHFIPGFLLALPVLIILMVWTIIIKGFALWKSARNSDKAWFIVLLVVNTLGILEIVYLLWFAKDARFASSASTPTTPAPAAESSGPEA